MRASSTKTFILWAATFTVMLTLTAAPSIAADKKPNILLIVSDDTGYGDLGPYGGGEGRGMPTPNSTAWRPMG
jgi:arylsulfatase